MIEVGRSYFVRTQMLCFVGKVAMTFTIDGRIETLRLEPVAVVSRPHVNMPSIPADYTMSRPYPGGMILPWHAVLELAPCEVPAPNESAAW